MRARTTLALISILLTGCGGVLSTAPASDDSTSRLDERLIGFWRVDSAATPEEKEEAILVVGRRKESEKGLELATLSLKHDKTIEVDRGEFLATTIGEKDYVSLRVLESPGDKDAAMSDAGGVKGTASSAPLWAILRYAMPDGDTLRIIGMSEKAAADDVRAGKIPGRVEERKGQGGAEPTLTVAFETTTGALRAYLQSRGDGLFKDDKPLVLRRLRLR